MSDLTAAVDTLTDSVKELGDAVKSTRTRIRWIIVSIVLDVCLSIGLGFVVRDQQHIAATRARDTTSARLAACQQYNAQQANAIRAVDAHDLALVNFAAPPPRAPFRQREAALFLTAMHADSVKHYKVRDCSPAGIGRYYSPATTTTKHPATKG